MSSTVPTPAPIPAPSEWSEEKLLESLRRLDDLHNRLIGLRTVIPKILHPLTANYATPVDMFHDFSTRAVSCSEDIAMFNTLYVKSSEIFEHAANTRAKDSNGIHRLPAGDMFLPDELEGEGTEGEGEEGEDKKKKKKKKQKQEGGDGEDVEMKDAPGKEETVEEEDEVVEDTKDNEVEEVLENFSARIMQRDVKVEEVPGGSPARRELKVLLPPPSSLLFVIEITPATPEHSRAFVVTAVKSSRHPDAPTQHLHTGVLRAVTARQWPGNLGMLLEMLAAYKTIFSARCDKCKRLTAGTKAALPVVRKLIRDGAGREKRWIGLHEGCA